MYGSSIYVDQLKLLNISLFEYIRYTMGIWVISLTISVIKVRSCISIDRRKFRNQNSDSMDRWKAEVGIHGGKSQRREEKRSEEKKREDQRREGVRRKKIQAREKAGKSRNTVFPMICGSGGSKSRLAKAAGAEPSGQMRDEKLHAAVVRSTFPSQNVQNTPCSDHFWKLRCPKSARCCGAKHV